MRPPQRTSLALTRVSPGSPSLQTIADLFARSKQIVAITGAGISTAAGIPDFRSKNGLYANGELFRQSSFNGPESSKILQTTLQLRDTVLRCEPTKTHQWLVSLQSKLRRWYTQNIDMLEQKAGLSLDIDNINDQSRCIPLHGSLAWLKCNFCHGNFEWDEYRKNIQAGRDLPCARCARRCDDRVVAGLRRTTTIGQLQPSIIMSDTPYHPQGGDIAELFQRDREAPTDVLLILGTSLKREGPKQQVRLFAQHVRAQGGMVVYVNATKPANLGNGLVDYWVDWECDEWVSDLLGRQQACRPGSTREHPIVID
ncbi:DHS-like NAD/FAD-binding domain-containing protein [Coniochaeta sp. 2T2.1]|nr:DHS-like NAD/FAD-binding domain-containing protein [Coniochaeta sp. 2T2.1]KAB5526471.1 DHS-like NAD/FAD-binding domain-containing protein [Coniochaeta sp. 2T2.1]